MLDILMILTSSSFNEQHILNSSFKRSSGILHIDTHHVYYKFFPYEKFKKFFKASDRCHRADFTLCQDQERWCGEVNRGQRWGSQEVIAVIIKDLKPQEQIICQVAIKLQTFGPPTYKRILCVMCSEVQLSLNS